MGEVLMEFPVKDAYALAEPHFSRICGFVGGSEKQERMKKQAMEVYESIAGRIRLCAAVSDFPPERLEDDTLTVNGIPFRCNAFGLLNEEAVQRCYIYLLTAGEPETESDRISDLLFADIWATSFIEAGRQLLSDKIAALAAAEFDAGVLTDSFGPGYYGMGLDQVEHFFKALDAESIDVRLHKSGVILPLKTCTGMFLFLKEGSEMPPATCEGCLGNTGGCRFCAALSTKRGTANL